MIKSPIWEILLAIVLFPAVCILRNPSSRPQLCRAASCIGRPAGTSGVKGGGRETLAAPKKAIVLQSHFFILAFHFCQCNLNESNRDPLSRPGSHRWIQIQSRQWSGGIETMWWNEQLIRMEYSKCLHIRTEHEDSNIQTGQHVMF